MSRMTIIEPQDRARLSAYLSQVPAPVADREESLGALINAYQAEVVRLRNMGCTQHEIARVFVEAGVRRSERTIVRALSRHFRSHSRKRKITGGGTRTARQRRHADHATERPAAASAAVNTQRSKSIGQSINLDDY